MTGPAGTRPDAASLVEESLRRHPAILDAAVVTLPSETPGHADLCAYFVADGFLAAAALRGHLLREAGPGPIPARYVQIDRIPRGADGGVDEAALPEPGGAAEWPEHLAPRDETETALLRVWEAVLGIQGIGIRDSLYELGGDSLAAARLAVAARAEFDADIPVTLVLRHPTVEAMAGQLRCPGGAERPTRSPAIARSPQRSHYPLSPQQRRVYVDQFKDPDSVQYNLPLLVALPPDIDLDRLTAAVQQLIDRHDILRSAFRDVDGEPRQYVLDDVPFRLEQSAAAAGRPAIRPFDLACPPLIRAQVIGGDTLAVDIHHIVTDGVSLGLMTAEIQSLYDGAALPPVDLQYADYAEWATGDEAASGRDKDEEHWLAVFAEPLRRPRPDLPTDAERPPIRQRAGSSMRFRIDGRQTARLRAVAGSHDVTLFAVLAAGYCAFLGAITGSDDVTVGTPMLGRGFPGGEQAVGMFATTVCLRARPRPASRFADFLLDVHDALVAAAEHQDYPFDALIEQVGGERDFSRTPLFDTLLAFQDRSLHRFELLGSEVQPAFDTTGETMFDLDLQIYEAQDHLDLVWTYSTALFTAQTAQSLRAEFEHVLAGIPEDVTAPLATLTGRRAGQAAQPLPEIVFEF